MVREGDREKVWVGSEEACRNCIRDRGSGRASEYKVGRVEEEVLGAEACAKAGYRRLTNG